MPELPEVETLRRGLLRHLVGRRVIGVELRLLKLVAEGRIGALDGALVLGISRRAKHLMLETSAGCVLVHLSLAGQLVLRAPDGSVLVAGGHPVPTFGAELPHRSTHLILDLDDGSRLFLTDIRHFARLWVLPPDQAEARLAKLQLGPEPIDDRFTVDALRRALARRRRPLKPTLLDQRVVAGLGNIYVDEALWQAGLHPSRPAGTLDEREAARLHAAIRAVLDYALTHGVAEVLDGRARPGSSFPAVHGREGQPCPRCEAVIEKRRVGGRGTYTCPTCQG